MGCEFTVLISPDQPDPMTSAQAALSEIGELEDLLSIYRGDSAVSRLNQQAAGAPIRVPYRLFELLERAAELTDQTGGAFDAACGALIRAWGFSSGPRRIPSAAELEAARARSGMRHVVLDRRAMTVHYTVPGVEINLGSIGKGYAIDRAMQLMRTGYGTDCVLIQGGRSSVGAIGSPAGDDCGWPIAVEDPDQPDRLVAVVRLRDRALATSSTRHQFFEAEGQRYGHLIDPRTGHPAATLASATALAPDAATADALSTALFVMGLDKAAEFCQNHPEVAALLVTRRNRAGGPNAVPRVVTFNLPPQDVELTPGSDSPGRRD